MMSHANRLRTITLEEHYATVAFMEGPGKDLGRISDLVKINPRMAQFYSNLAAKLTDIDEKRIAEMDDAGIDVQILSLTSPGTEQLAGEEAVKVARETNDTLAKAINVHPDRLGGFATLPTAVPDKAAAELERTVRDYRFKGALINGHCRGRYLDDPYFWPIFERAQELNVPIYLHPTRPPQEVSQKYYTGNFSQQVAMALQIAAWGWHIETAVHVIRIVAGRVFDEYPKLQLVIGHLGEGLPFMIQRLDQTLSRETTGLERPSFSSYLRENVHYTFSGFNFLSTFLDLLLEVGVDRIMFSADYPYAPMKEARDFLDRIPVTPADRKKIAHGNAEKLFKF
jgi:uncharacterized protein